MCLLIYLGSIILLANFGHCDLTWDKVYGLLSATLDKIILDQDLMKQEMKDLVTSMTATSQQVISLEKKLSEVSTLSQQMVVFQERLDNMDSHVTNLATAEVGRAHLLRRGLEQEKAATQSRLNSVQQIQEGIQSDISVLMSATDDFRAQISDVEEKIKSTMNQTAEILSRNEDKMSTHLNGTRVLISYLEQEMVDTVGRFGTLEKTQSDIKEAANKTQARIATMEQKVTATQSNTNTLQSRVQIIEETQRDLKSKTSSIESQIGTTQGQISRLQNTVGTFVGFSAFLKTKKDYYNYYDKNTVIIFDEVIYNQGSHYSTSTGIFTVPVSGVYIFTFNVEVDCNYVDTHIVAHVNLRLNSDIKSQAAVRGWGFHLSSGNTAVLDVRYGDKVYVYTSNQYERHKIFPQRTTFSGALLHVN